MAKDPIGLSQYRVQDWNRPEDIAQPLYDRANYPAAGVGTLSFFAIARGGTATLVRAGVTSSVSKTSRDTNLDSVGQLTGRDYLAIGMSMAFIPVQEAYATANTNAIVDDIQRLLHGGWLEWKVGDKSVLLLPLHLIPSYTYLQGLATTTGAAGVQNRAERGYYPLYPRVGIKRGTTFTVTLTFDGSPATVQSTDIFFSFHGVLRRPT